MKDNLNSKNIKAFSTDDTLYIKLKESGDTTNFFLCQFVSFDAKKNTVTGKVIEADSNPNLYNYKIKEGWVISANLSNCGLYGKPVGSSSGYFHWFNTLGYALDPLEEHKVVGNELHVSKHPSFGVISASRRSSSHGVPLFGSSIQHSNTIAITISTATHNRDNSYDRIYEDKRIIEIELSQTQFAEFITSMNMGSGTPCTIKYKDNERLSEPPYISKIDSFNEEFTAKMHNLTVDMRKNINNTLEILKNKSTLNKGDKDLIIKGIEGLSKELNNSIPYIGKLFNEQMDKTILEAKNEIEAFVENKIRSTGIEALNNPDVIKQLQQNTSFHKNEQ